MAEFVRVLLTLAAAALLTTGCGSGDDGGAAPEPLATGAVRIAVVPDTLAFPWTLAGPPGGQATGSGSALLNDRPVGAYTLVWGEVAGWVRPVPAVATGTLAGGDTLVLAGTYLSATVAALDLAVEPVGLPAPWQLTGPGGFTATGRGAASLTDLAPGVYEVAWSDPVGWAGEGAADQVVDLVPGGTATASRSYSQVFAWLALVVGDEGTLLRSTDRGRTWTAADAGTTRRLAGVFLASPDAAVVVGDRGTLRISRDGGLSWIDRRLTSARLSSVAFADARHGLAVGEAGAVLVTGTGGESWGERSMVEAANLWSVACQPGAPLVAVVAAQRFDVEGGLPRIAYRTDDGGLNWWRQDLAPANLDLRGAALAADGTLLLVGEDERIYRAGPGADSAQLAHDSGDGGLHAVAFASRTAVDVAVAVGRGGRLLRTVDGGVTWQAVAGPTALALNAVAFAGADVVVAVGDSGAMLRSEDGGATWTVLPPSTESDLRGVHVVATAPEGTER